MNKSCTEAGTSHPMRAESVNFRNGMIVTADDLSTAINYPVALMQAVNTAVYGCGVVCGFRLEGDPELCGRRGRCDPCNEDSDETFPNFVIQVGRGTAIDCYGMPIELCTPVRVTIAPEACGCDAKGGEVCILIRRCSATEAPRGDCCGPVGGTAECSRVRDHVEIRAYPAGDIPDHTCMRPRDEIGAAPENGNGDRPPYFHPGRYPHQNRICDCLVDCDRCGCCGDGWVLLGCVGLCEGGIVRRSLENAYHYRKWIKPIECQCRNPRADESYADTAGDYAETLTDEEVISAVRGDEGLALMIRKDPGFEEDLEKVVDSEAHRKFFRAVGIANMEHLAHYIETNRDLLVSMVQFSRYAAKLDDYVAVARRWGDMAGKAQV